MNNLKKTKTATLALTAALVLGATAPAASAEPIVIKLPTSLCTLQVPPSPAVVRALTARSDFERWLNYMLDRCPEVGLAFADVATASIGTTDSVHEDGSGFTGPGAGSGSGGSGSGSSGGIGSGNSGSGTGGEGGGSGGQGGGAGDTGDDGDNGHGNDTGKRDNSNPGRKP